MVIFCDAKHEGLWFRDLSPLLSDASFETIGGRGTNPPIIEKLIYYDRPDIILLYDGEPVLVLEKTSEVPSGHNIGQRLGRMVRALEYEVPAIMFMPFDSMKHGKFSSLCNLNARVLEGYLRMWDIHSTPALAVNWPSDSDWELITDGSEDDGISAVVHDFIQSGFDWGCDEFFRHRALMAEEFTRRVASAFTGLVLAATGRTSRLLAIDLDNTLWGGVVGEEGLGGIALGQDYPGNAYLAFQQSVLRLHNSGVLLCISSKNNEDDVWQVFREHPHMILSEEHIAAARVNWDDKATNLTRIRSRACSPWRIGMAWPASRVRPAG